MKSLNLKNLLLLGLVLSSFVLMGGSADTSLLIKSKTTVPEQKVIPIFIPIPVPPISLGPELIKYINEVADYYKVPRMLVYKLIYKESTWRQSARHYNRDTNTGKILSIDVGLMQLNSLYIPWMIEKFGTKGRKYDVYASAYNNIFIGIKYLSWLYGRMQSWRLAVMAYNCGPNNVQINNIPVRTLQYANYIVPVENWWEDPENVVLYYE